MTDEQPIPIAVTRTDVPHGPHQIKRAANAPPLCRHCGIVDGVMHQLNPDGVVYVHIGGTPTLLPPIPHQNDGPYRVWTCTRCHRTILDSDTDPTHA